MQDRRKHSYKPAIQSQTIIGAMVIIIVNLAALAGWTVNADNASAMVEAIITIAGAGYVIWRRFKTRTRIRGLLSATKPEPNE